MLLITLKMFNLLKKKQLLVGLKMVEVGWTILQGPEDFILFLKEKMYFTVFMLIIKLNILFL